MEIEQKDFTSMEKVPFARLYEIAYQPVGSHIDQLNPRSINPQF